jgi:DNA repair protein RadA/Sms
VPAAAFRDLSEVSASEHDRTSTGIPELDRVLGGGLVPGSYIILAGVPGAGKTTVATQAIISLASAGVKTAYVSGEESEAQARMRFERLGADFGAYPLPISSESGVERVCEAIEANGYDFVVVDSIQTMISEGLPGRPGSITQVAECGDRLRATAKSTGTTILLVGQVTKDGDMAGPRLLEHMVDVVLQFEGERDEQMRVLRAVKNRFGSTDEIGVFEMTGQGLEGIPDPSSIFLAERDFSISGSAVCAALEGTRIVLCEIQALVRPSNSPMPMRQAMGIDSKRLSMLLAVMSKAGYYTGSYDVFVKVIGGFMIGEPAADLAVCVALASAFERRATKPNVCAYGEVTLQGKVRAAAQAERRGKEADRLGYVGLETAGTLKSVLASALGSVVEEAEALTEENES